MNLRSRDLESRAFEIGTKIIEGSKQRKKFSANDAVFDVCMKDPPTKTQLLRFIDILPNLGNSKEIVSHLDEYLLRNDLELDLGVFTKGIGVVDTFSHLTPGVVAPMINYCAKIMAKGFIAGDDINAASRVLKKLSDKNMEFSLDHLGEKTLCEKDADSYMESYFETADALSRKFGKHTKDKFGKPKINLSVKISALYSRFDAIDPEDTCEAVKGRLRRIFRKAKDVGAFVNLDTEDYEKKDLTGRIFKELLCEDEFKNYDAGIVVQAYLTDSEKTLRDFIDWGKETKHPFTIRLVKGAYWDHEVMLAQKNGWEIPVYTEKWQSDANYEDLTRILLENTQHVGTAIASHNIRSVAYALALQENLGVNKNNFEVQMLYGMGREIKETLVDQNVPLRVYAPYGDLISGMGYFVRRLLENSSNEGFLRAFDKDADPEKLLKNPKDVGGDLHA